MSKTSRQGHVCLNALPRLSFSCFKPWNYLARLTLLIAIAILFVPAEVTANDLEGIWVGVMESGGQYGDAKIVISKAADAYSATFSGLRSFSGQLYNVHYGPGKKPNTMTLTMMSRKIRRGSAGNVVLKFYLIHDPYKTRLSGVAKFDYESGQDLKLRVILERQPCCHPECLHVGKSRCY